MARGSASKDAVTQKILETFPGAFKYEKEIRIPMVEAGEELQIKCVLTAAKVNVENGGDTAAPGSIVTSTIVKENGFPSVNQPEAPLQPTEEEMRNVETMLGALGFFK